jgi:hypothetical protein
MSLVVTTTIPPEKWSEILQDESVVGAVAHRLINREYLLEATGPPYPHLFNRPVVLGLS